MLTKYSSNEKWMHLWYVSLIFVKLKTIYLKLFGIWQANHEIHVEYEVDKSS